VNKVVVAILGVMAALVVAVGITIIVVVAGGDDENTTSGSGDPTEEPGDNGDGGGPAEGELRLLGGEPLTLDPALAQDATSAVYIVEIFGGLVTLDTELALQPDLAAELPSAANGGKVVNADGTVTYTFRLRDNLQFHDRKPVTADDVKFSLERAADPATQSLVSEFFLGDIVGVKEKLDGQAEEIGGVKVVDDATIAITIERDLPNFLYKLTYPVAYVVDQTQV
jgi:ABC-type transport system substrate-binding protein